MRNLSLFLAGALAVSGCVKKSTYQAEVAKAAQLQKDLDAASAKQKETDAKVVTLGDKIKELEGKLGILDESTKSKEAELGKVKGEQAASQAELAELRKQRDLTEKRIAAYKAMQDKFRALVDTGKLQVVFRNGQMTIKLPSGILFASGSDDLSKDGQAALGEVVKILVGFKDRRFLVAGHTDNQPIKTREFPNNWYLSTARANSVVQFMIKQGFPAKGVGAAGYGEFDPVAKNDTEPNREQNRRIEIILVPNLEELPSLTGG
jgi:chemotaxis protein MotB